jgi:hypothetical protein
MSIPGRIYNVAKAHLDKALQRWDEIDERARQELDAITPRASTTGDSSAWERAAAKIAAARAAQELSASSSYPEITQEREARPPVDQLAPSSNVPQADALRAAYSIIGVAAGADWLTVQQAYSTLRDRAAPERFPAGSPEQVSAQAIRKRIDSAYVLLQNALCPSGDRFDRLEF